MNPLELKSLRGPLLLLAAVLLAGCGAVYYTHLLWKQAEIALTQQRGQLREAQTRMQRSGDEKTIIVKYVDEYRKLQASGFIGNEQRINWLDALRLANARTDLSGVNYEIGIQQNYPNAIDMDPGRIVLRQSIMKLDLRLLHELDLLRFFDTLRAQNTGLFHLDRCTMRRTDMSDAIRNQPHVTASCQLAWITATPESQPGGRP